MKQLQKAYKRSFHHEVYSSSWPGITELIFLYDETEIDKLFNNKSSISTKNGVQVSKSICYDRIEALGAVLIIDDFQYTSDAV